LSSGPEHRRAAAKQIVGLATRTANTAESDPATAQISKLWERFRAEGWAERLDEIGAVGPTMAVYSAYESDVSGSYQLLVGREVPSSPPVSVPLQVSSIAQGPYLTFRCSGSLPDAIIGGWREVWKYFARANAPARAYTSDFEIYPEAGPAEIWVAVQG